MTLKRNPAELPRAWHRELPRLPALTALRAFEAAARHESFSRAATELFVTHGAVSHQVRALEEELGQPLFARNGKRVSLTPAGRVYAERVRDALLQIAEATRALQSVTRDEVDVALRMGSGDYPGLYVERLLDDVFFPVCSPSFLGGKLPARPEDMQGLTLLRGEGDPWRPWFEAAGLDWPEPRKGLMFEDSSLLLQAAAEGQGIALIRSSLAYNDLLSGRVVRLFDVSIPCPWLLYFVCAPAMLDTPKVQAFRTWLLPEIAAFRQVLSQWA